MSIGENHLGSSDFSLHNFFYPSFRFTRLMKTMTVTKFLQKCIKRMRNCQGFLYKETEINMNFQIFLILTKSNILF